MNQYQYDSLRSFGLTGALYDMLLAFYKGIGITGDTLQDLEMNYLISRGYTEGSLQDRWVKVLADNGYTGPLSQSLANAWKDSIPFLSVLYVVKKNGGTILLSGLQRNFLDSSGTTAATVDNPVGLVQDSVGSNNATQATTGSKPTLRRDANGRYYWQFDPAAPGDFFSTGITTGNEGWVCAGVTLGAVGVGHHLFGNGAAAATDVGVWLRVASTNNTVTLLVSNGTSRELVSAVASSFAGVPKVIDGGWNASTLFAAIDGVETSAAKTVNCTTSKTCQIGGSSVTGWYTNGAMPVQVICPTLPPPADRVLIRKWVAKQQGQTL